MSGVTKGVSFTLPRHNGVTEKINVINGCRFVSAGKAGEIIPQKAFQILRRLDHVERTGVEANGCRLPGGHKRDKERSPAIS